MPEQITLRNFKNFRDATLSVQKFTVIVGTNASGKSNIRDAFMFLHGMARGYTLADIFGEIRGPGGELQWAGIRGGIREAAFHGTHRFTIQTTLSTRYEHSITVDTGEKNQPAQIVEESLRHEMQYFFTSEPDDRIKPSENQRKVHLAVGGALYLSSLQPLLTQISTRQRRATSSVSRQAAISFQNCFDSMRFIDFAPESMRRPSLPGQVVLGDRGENLSSVLQFICNNTSKKNAIQNWISQLTPLDLKDFEFDSDQTGRILVSLVESNGHRTSAYSASDGTLRFLGLLALLFGPNRPEKLFIDEIDTGIHPTRLHLLVELIEQQAENGGCEVIATTHSPYLLGTLSEKSKRAASLVYRLEGEPEAHIVRILDIPEAKHVLKAQPLSRLHESGWLEDAVSFMNGQKEEKG